MIPAGGSQQVGLTLDLRCRNGQTPTQGRRLIVDLYPEVRGGLVQRLKWTLEADVLEPVTCDLAATQLGKRNAGEHDPEFDVPIRLAPGVVAATAATAASDASFARVRMVDEHERGSSSLAIALLPTCPMGDFYLDVNLSTLSDGKTVVTEPIRFHGELAAEVLAQPRRVVFGSVPVGDRAVGELIVHAERTTFTILEAYVEGAGLSLERVSDGDVGQVAYRLTCSPSEAGSHQGAVTFAIQSSERKTPPLFAIPVFWHGTTIQHVGGHRQ